MPEPVTKKRIFISACEPSAEAHCANLIKAVGQIKGLGDNVEWVGVGGEKMAQAGCELLESTAGRAVMIYKVVAQINFYHKLLKRISDYLQTNKVDLVIVCDSPAFNFQVAKAAKKASIKVLFYVAPQLWAWAGWRISKLRRLGDKLACILPFEQSWFSDRGVDATFVGNPVFDDLNIDIKDSYKDYADFYHASARIAIMPGSRHAEIKSLWPAMQRVGLKLKKKWHGIEFIAVAPDEEKLQLLKNKQLRGFECEYMIDEVARAASLADFTLVASGSATLQVAAAGCPMVIMYHSSRILWHLLGRWLVKTRFLSLVNILAGRELVPEFMPHYGKISAVFDKCRWFLTNKSVLVKTSRELVDMVKPMAQGRASDRIAQMVIKMMED